MERLLTSTKISPPLLASTLHRVSTEAFSSPPVERTHFSRAPTHSCTASQSRKESMHAGHCTQREDEPHQCWSRQTTQQEREDRKNCISLLFVERAVLTNTQRERERESTSCSCKSSRERMQAQKEEEREKMLGKASSGRAIEKKSVNAKT